MQFTSMVKVESAHATSCLCRFFEDLSVRAGFSIAPIVVAVDLGNIDLVKELYENGADIGVRYRGRTLLDNATSGGWFEIMDFLVNKARFDVDTENGLGYTALGMIVDHYLTLYPGNVSGDTTSSIVAKLKELGANPEVLLPSGFLLRRQVEAILPVYDPVRVAYEKRLGG